VWKDFAEYTPRFKMPLFSQNGLSKKEQSRLRTCNADMPTKKPKKKTTTTTTTKKTSYCPKQNIIKRSTEDFGSRV